MRGNKLPSNQRHGQETNQPTDNPFNQGFMRVRVALPIIYLFSKGSEKFVVQCVVPKQSKRIYDLASGAKIKDNVCATRATQEVYEYLYT